MNNIDRLGELLASQMRNTASENISITAELGIIGADMSLHVSSIKNSIPKGQYMISRSLSFGKTGSKLTETIDDSGKHEHTGIEKSGEHKHDVILPECMRSVSAGDRVLVVWVGSEAIVVDIVKSS